MSLLDLITGGSSEEATDANRKALEAIQNVQTPSVQSLSLPELEKYAVSQNMTPAQMQAFLQQNNALGNENVDQTGTQAQISALNQLAGVANAGASGSPTAQAQEAKINQDAARNLAGQRGAIEQSAQARGVPLGLLQAALQSQQAGSNQQDAHMAALQAQGQNYQQALQALSGTGSLGGSLQGQQNTQANTVAQAQNAMQQFNAANQQQASANNAGFQQAANATNTQNANQAGAANTGLANQRTQYNAQVPQTVFQDQFQKANGVANQYNNAANTATGQGQQNAGIFSGLLGAGATLAGGPIAGAAASALTAPKSGAMVQPMPPPASSNQYAPPGYACGGEVMNMKSGGPVPGQAQVPGDSPKNDTVNAKLSPGEVVLPRTMVQSHPEDIAALLQAMKHLRGGTR